MKFYTGLYLGTYFRAMWFLSINVFTGARGWNGATKRLNKTPWPECASELYRPSNDRLTAQLVPTFSDTECQVVEQQITTAVLSIYRPELLLFFQVDPQLYSRG
jgi:hypothetical protein